MFRASNLISEGSELLLLVPSLAGLVGGVVLPLLGAVPDGAIMVSMFVFDSERLRVLSLTFNDDTISCYLSFFLGLVRKKRYKSLLQ